jgi:hypothetical protein
MKRVVSREFGKLRFAPLVRIRHDAADGFMRWENAKRLHPEPPEPSLPCPEELARAESLVAAAYE